LSCWQWFLQVEDSCVYLGVDCSIDYLRRVVFIFGILSDFFDDIVEGIYLAFDLPLDLLNAQPLPKHYYQLRSFFIETAVFFRPIDENGFEVSLRDGFLTLVTSLAVGEDLGEGVVESTCEGKGEPFLPFRDRYTSIHRFLLRSIGTLLRNHFPSSSSHFLIDLHDDL